MSRSSPTRSTSSVTRPSVRPFSHPRRRGTVAMLSRTVRWGNRPICWITYPISRRSSWADRPLPSLPLTRICPLVGSMSRLIILSVVVFPHPDGPTRTQTSPSAIASERSPTAGAPRPKRLVTLPSWMAASMTISDGDERRAHLGRRDQTAVVQPALDGGGPFDGGEAWPDVVVRDGGAGEIAAAGA